MFNTNLETLKYEKYNGDWDNMPNGLWICSGSNPNAPDGNDGYQWLVNCEKNLSINNYMQQAYRITGTSSAAKTLYRYGNSNIGWRDWYAPYITNADLMIFGGAKSIAIATETNIVHMYFYTDEDKRNGYRIDANGTTKRLSLLRITNGSSAEICGVGMS